MLVKILLILIAVYTVRNIYLKLKSPEKSDRAHKGSSNRSGYKKPDAVDVEYTEVDPD